MQELLIVNPAKRPSKRRKSTKAASPAQKRARAAFAARARSRAGVKRRTKRRSPTAVTVMTNPRRRRRSVVKHTARRSKRRSNPISLSAIKKPMALITPALMGAVGAIAVNTILSKLPLPAVATTGKMRYVTQGAAAILLAVVAQKLGVKGAMAAQMAEGSLTVTLHDAIKEVAGGMGMNLSGGLGYYLPGVGVGNAVPSRSANPAQMAGMGKYMTGPGSPGMAGMASPKRAAGFKF